MKPLFSYLPVLCGAVCAAAVLPPVACAAPLSAVAAKAACPAPLSLNGATLTLQTASGERRVFHLNTLVNIGGRLFYLPAEGIPESTVDGVSDACLTYFSYAVSGNTVQLDYAYRTENGDTVYMRGSNVFHANYAMGQGLPAIGQLQPAGGNSFNGSLNGVEWRGDGTVAASFVGSTISINFEDGADVAFSPWEMKGDSAAEQAARLLTRMQPLAFTADGAFDPDFVNWVVEHRMSQQVAGEDSLSDFIELYGDYVTNISQKAKTGGKTPIEIMVATMNFARSYPKRSVKIFEVGMRGNEIAISLAFYGKQSSTASASVSAGILMTLQIADDGRIIGMGQETFVGENHPALPKGFKSFPYQGQTEFTAI